MNLAALLNQLRPTGLDGLAFPRNLLGAFRRKSITYCTGVTDETTIVYWVQSKTFSIDLRLPDAELTPATERQGWIGDTVWDEEKRQLSWAVDKSYQPRNQWPEPAELYFIGNSVIEFAPSRAYVEDWRQQSSRGPFMGLRLMKIRNEATGEEAPMDGGLVIAGEHAGYVQSRLPHIDDALKRYSSLADVVSDGRFSKAEIESYEVSVAIDGDEITHSTQPWRRGEKLSLDGFAIGPNDIVTQEKVIGGEACVLTFKVDVFEPDFAFDLQTPCDAAARDWMKQESGHLSRHAVLTC